MKKFMLFALLLITTIVYAQDDSWKFSGHFQLRTELDGRDFYNKTFAPMTTSMRTRVGVEKSFMDKMNLFVQMQDSRLFGSEANTLANSANVDVHQAYVKLKDIFDLPVTIQAGRFEMAFGTERFFGAVGWHYVGRSFDGVRFSFDWGMNTDVFFITHNTAYGYISNATPVYPLPPANNKPVYNISGLRLKKQIDDSHNVELLGYYEDNNNSSNRIDKDLAQYTFAGTHFGSYGNLSSITEAAYQLGKRGPKDVSAYLLSVIGSYKLSEAKLSLGADILSGTETNVTDKNNSFSPTFGTNHKFYGFMDYFISIPTNTFSAGLHDLYFMYDWTPASSKYSGSLAIHHFTSNVPGGFANANTFGHEIDLTLRYIFIKGTTISWGGSVFLPEELMKSAWKKDAIERKDPSFWSYIMITAAL